MSLKPELKQQGDKGEEGESTHVSVGLWIGAHG
jgi:hypothetical protein